MNGKFNMYAAGLIGSLLVFLLLNFFSDLIYRGIGHHGEAPLGFAVAVEESAAETETAGAIDWAVLIAAADAAKGEKVFGKCKSCHSVEDGKNGVGPSLHRVVGRAIGSVAGFSYSADVASHGGVWDLGTLMEFLNAPKSFAPGTKMTFAGLPKAEDRVNVIAYLNEAGGAPIELVAPDGTALAPAATETAVATAGTAPAATENAPAAGTTAAATTETAPAAAATAPAATGTAPSATEATVAAASGTGDATNGEKVFKKCRACHQAVEGKNGVGPSLWGVVGRAVASVEGFNYSDAMLSRGGTWDFAALDAFLSDPKGTVPGTKMTFPGLKSEQDRLDVITYLNEADGTPVPLQ